MKLTTKFILTVVLAVAMMGADAQEVANIADPRLPIKLPTVRGDSLSLSSLKGTVILLDFWASWCMPCRAANKKLVRLYDKYKGDGFEIFSVSVDEDKRDWERAIAKDRITWLQVNDPRGTMASTVLDWNVSVLPTTFLINRNGDVVAVDLEGRDLEKAVRKLLEK